MRRDINPSIWGKSAWTFIDNTIEAQPDNPSPKEIHEMRNFILGLGKILPCLKCRKSFETYIITYPLTIQILSNRAKLKHWFAKYKQSV